MTEDRPGLSLADPTSTPKPVPPSLLVKTTFFLGVMVVVTFIIFCFVAASYAIFNAAFS